MGDKQLKTLQLTDYAKLIEDINYNFSVLLSSPMFVGMRGGDGAAGNTGNPGIRGSKWMYCNVNQFNDVFGDNLINEYQITIEYLNSKLLSSTDRSKLLIATGAGDMFVSGDTFVVNGLIYVIDLENNIFVDTNQTINTTAEILGSSVQEYIKSLFDDLIKNDPALVGLVQTVDAQQAEAKNYTDSSSNINNTINPGSLLDVTTSTSKPGAKISTHKIYNPASAVFADYDKLLWVFGGKEEYHTLIQKTIAYDESSTSNIVASYGPTYKNTPTVAILQNTYDSGLIMGHANANNFSEFMKSYVDRNLNLHIQSPNISERYLKFSEIVLGYNKTQIISDDIDLVGDVSIKGIRLEYNTSEQTMQWIVKK